MKFRCPLWIGGECTSGRCDGYLTNAFADGNDEYGNQVYTAACTVDSPLRFFYQLHPEVDQEPETATTSKKPRQRRKGFSQRYIAYIFMRDIRTVRRWERDPASAPPGYSKALRLSGNNEELMKVARAFHWANRIKGGDVYDKKLIVHFKSDETLFRMMTEH